MANQWNPDEVGVLMDEQKRLEALEKLALLWDGKTVYDLLAIHKQLLVIRQTIANYTGQASVELETDMREVWASIPP